MGERRCDGDVGIEEAVWERRRASEGVTLEAPPLEKCGHVVSGGESWPG